MTQPGETTLMRMRCSPSSAARPRVRPIDRGLRRRVHRRLPRLAAVGVVPKLTIEPPPIFFMPGTTAWIAKKAGRWFMAMR